MASGRMINNAITKDLRINQLSDDTSRLSFTWLITFADRDGRTYGDPAIVRSMLFPRRDDITLAQMTGYIQEWHDLGLVIWYEASGDRFIFFPAFEKNQRGMRPEREAASIIPPHGGITPQKPIDNDDLTPELVRSNDGVSPEECRIKLKEVKRKEVKVTEVNEKSTTTTGEAFTKFQNEIGLLSPVTSDIVGGWIDDYSESWTIDAISEAVKNNVRKPAYIDAILKRWKNEGRGNGKINSEKVWTETA